MEYKYILGLSGGVDSCFALHTAVGMGYDVIAVTFDNGWDTETAIENRANICKKLKVKARNYSCDLYEFREIQRAFLLLSNMHAECPSDLGIKKSLLNAMEEYKADGIITGSVASEGNPPPNWSVVDGLYLKDVMRKHGRINLRTFPNMSLYDHIRYKRKTLNILSTIQYAPSIAKALLKDKYGWQDYGSKHYENTYTKFNQGLRYFKFGNDMRVIEKQHNYILNAPPYTKQEFMCPVEYVCNALDLDSIKIMAMPESNWLKYKSYRKYILGVKKWFFR